MNKSEKEKLVILSKINSGFSAKLVFPPLDAFLVYNTEPSDANAVRPKMEGSGVCLLSVSESAFLSGGDGSLLPCMASRLNSPREADCRGTYDK